LLDRHAFIFRFFPVFINEFDQMDEIGIKETYSMATAISNIRLAQVALIPSKKLDH